MKKQTKQTDLRDISLGERQHCPICKRYVRASTRYPEYACIKCQKLAVNKVGEKLEFFNTTLDGHGCQGRIVGGEKPVNSSVCFIKGKRFCVKEAYLGGIVMVPFPKAQRKVGFKK